MAAAGAEEDDGGASLDIDNVHMLLQVEHEQIQRRTFTNWINAQLSKRSPPTFVSDIFSDLRDGSQLLNLLEVMSGQAMKRQRGRGVFQQRANIETALSFLKKKSIKLVNINVSDIIDGRPSIVLGLIWTIILHCHLEELANTLTFSSCHSSLDSLASLDSWASSSVPASPVAAGRSSPLHRRFRVSARKALLMWVRDQCKKVACSIRVRDFGSSWRSGEAFLAILCSLRPQLVDLSLARSRSNQENLEEAFLLAERELNIPRILDPKDVDVQSPDEKSVITYVAQFLQYSNDMPAPDDHLELFPLAPPTYVSPVSFSAHFTPAVAVSPLHQVSSIERAAEVTCWLQQARQELSQSWTAAEGLDFAERYQVLQRFTDTFTEQRRPVTTLLAAAKRCPELSQQQSALMAAYDRLEEELQRCREALDSSLPPPLDSVLAWLQRAEAALTDEREVGESHADAAKDARTQQDNLETLFKGMSHYVSVLDSFFNSYDVGSSAVPLEQVHELRRRLTSAQVTAKYQGIKLEYQESRHTALDLLQCIGAKLQTWKAPYTSREAILLLLKDWHESVEHHSVLGTLTDSLQALGEKANAYTSMEAAGIDSYEVACQVKAAEREAERVSRATVDAKGALERAASAWETYDGCRTSLQTWLAHQTGSTTEAQDVSEWSACQAKLNRAGNLLIEVTEPSTSQDLAQQLSSVNRQWAKCMKRTVFDVPSESSPSGAPGPQVALFFAEEASRLLRQQLEVSATSLKTFREKLQLLTARVANDSPVASSPESHPIQEQEQTLKLLAAAERTCKELHETSSSFDRLCAELDRWATKSLDCLQYLRGAKDGGRSAAEHSVKVLVAQGSQLQCQLVNKGHNLLDSITKIQGASPLTNVTTSSLVVRISESMSRCEEILEMLNSVGIPQPVQTETGSRVVVRTKHTDQVTNVLLQAQIPNQFLAETPSGTRTGGLPQSSDTQRPSNRDELVIRPVHTQTPSQLSDEAAPRTHSPPHQSVQTLQLQCHTHAFGVTPAHERLSAPEQQVQPNSSQSAAASLRPPALSSSEIHSKAESMARSRLEKARRHLLGRIQQAIGLFGSEEISAPQVKRKQKALKVLQPAVLEEFLRAVQGFGAFCSGPKLEEVLVLSESVRNQWEDLCSEMAAFIPILQSEIRHREPRVSVDVQANILHEPTDLFVSDSVLHRQAIKEGGPSEKCVDSLRGLCETLVPVRSVHLATDQLPQEDEEQETTRPGATVLPGPQLQGDAPPSAAAKTCQDRNVPAELAVEDVQRSLPTGRSLGAARTQVDVKATCSGSGKHPKSSLKLEEQRLKARLLDHAGGCQQTQSPVQALVSSATLGTKQEAEWTVIAAVAAPQEEPPPGQEVQDRYKRSRLLFEAQLQNNKQHLEEFTTDGFTIAQLQTLQQRTETLWSEHELHYARLRQSLHLTGGEEKSEVETDWEHLARQWRTQRVDLNSRMTSLGSTTSMVSSADDQIAQIAGELDGLLQEPLDVSSSTSAHGSLLFQLKEVADRLDLKNRPGRGSAQEGQKLEQLRQRLARVDTAVRSLDGFLAAVKDVEATGGQTLPDWERDEQARQRLHSAAEQAERADDFLRAAGMTVAADGVTVTCRDMVTSLSQERRGTGPDSSEEQRQLAKRTSLGRDLLRVEKEKDKASAGEGEQRRSFQVRSDEGEKGVLVQRRLALLASLRETGEAAERLRLQEPSLPALQHRTRALTRLEKDLADRLPELQHVKDTLPSEQTRELEEAWQEAAQAVAERLEQCHVLAELLKRFQHVRGELSGTLQRAESAVGDQASYVGKDNLLRLHEKVQETKAELSGLGDRMEEVRSICRQLHTQLRQSAPECNLVSFEGEADALMDRWLDVSEKTDSSLEDLDLGLTLWDGVLQLAAEVESWTAGKLSAFALSPSFSAEEDIVALRSQIVTQEEKMERFHKRASEIQALLRSTEPPLELQVVGTQMSKKLVQLKELVSDAEEVYHQMAAAKEQLSARMTDCFTSLQKVQDALVALSGPDVQTVLTKLKELRCEFPSWEEQVEGLLRDVQLVASMESSVSLHRLSLDGIQLQDKVQSISQLFSEVEGKTERNVQALHRLQTESECFQRWLQATKERTRIKEDLHLLQEEALQQRRRSEVLNQLLWSLRDGPFRQSVSVTGGRKLLERYNNLCSSSETPSSLSRDVESASGPPEIKKSRIGVGGDDAAPAAPVFGIESLQEQQLHSDEVLASAPEKADVAPEEKQPHHDGDELKQDGAHHHHRRARLQAGQLKDESDPLQVTQACLDAHKELLAGGHSDHSCKETSSDDLTSRDETSLLHELKVLSCLLEEDVCAEDDLDQLLEDCSNKVASLQNRLLHRKAQNDEQITDRKAQNDEQITDSATLEYLLQELPNTEEDPLQILTLKHSMTAGSTGVSVPQQVGSLHYHKRALDGSVVGSPTSAEGEVEASWLQGDIQGQLSACGQESPDATELKQSRQIIQDGDNALPSPTGKLSDLRKTAGGSRTACLAAEAAGRDLDSLHSTFLERKQQFAADTLKQLISHLHSSKTLSPGKVGQDEPQALCDNTMSDQDLLPELLQTEKVEEGASGALDEGAQAPGESIECVSEVGQVGQQNVLGAEEQRPDSPRCFDSRSHQSDSSERASTPHHLHGDILDDLNSQQPTLPRIRPDTCRTVECDTDRVDSGDDPALVSSFGLDLEPLNPEPHLTTNSRLSGQLEFSADHEENTAVQALKLVSAVPEKTVVEAAAGPGRASDPEKASGLKVAQSQTLQSETGAWTQDKPPKGMNVTGAPTARILIVLDREPEAGQKNNSGGSDLNYSQVAGLCEANPKASLNLGSAETGSSLCPAVISVETGETGSGGHCLSKSSPEDQSAPALFTADVVNTRRARAKLPHQEETDTVELVHADGSASPELHSEVRGLAGARAAGATFLPVSHVAMTDLCHAAERTMSSALNLVEGGEAQSESSSGEPVSLANATRAAAGAGSSARAEEINPRVASESESCQSEAVKPAGQGEQEPASGEQSLLEVSSVEDTKTAGGMDARSLVGGETAECRKHECSVLDILKDVQNLVERSHIINRMPHVDLNWYLESTPGEPEIQLTRTIQNVLACRYRPARLDVATMAEQLKEAEDYRCSVLEQVATMRSTTAAKVCDPDVLKRLEGRWNTALLNASATVHVKATQLAEVQAYHKQMRIIRAFLEVLAGEREKSSLLHVGSSALQAERLAALLQTMAQKKDLMEELLHLSSQISVYLSDAESSGTLLAQLGDVQEEWRLLQGTFMRSLQQASSSNCQHSLLIKEAEQLKAKLEAFQRASFQKRDSRSTLECICLASDLKLYTQLYLRLQSQSDSLDHFSLGKKEKDEVKRSLQELASLLSVTKSKLNTSAHKCGGVASAKTEKHLLDLITWAKQAENHMLAGQRLALFPEEARVQINEMKKSYSDFMFRRSTVQVEVEHMKDQAHNSENNDLEQISATAEDLCDMISENFNLAVDTMTAKLEEREKLLCQLAHVDAWLAETQAKVDLCSHVDSVTNADIGNLKGELTVHKSATVDIEKQLKVVEALMESCKGMAAELSPGDSRYLVNRLSGLWTELDGLLANAKATSWELKELIHERASADEELENIQTSLRQISADLEQQTFPLTQDTVLAVERWKHMLMEHQCEVQELPHCQEARRSSILCTIGELQDQCKALCAHAFEQDKYVHLRRQMEESRDAAQERVERSGDDSLTVGERFKLCQSLLVELPLVKTQCQEAADQLEAVAQELSQPELEAERRRISRSVETLVSWEESVTVRLKILENQLLPGLRFSTEYPALMELFQGISAELAGARPVNPDEKSIDGALRRRWVIWRNTESGMRLLEGLGRRENVDLKNCRGIHSLRDSNKKECHLQMDSLSQARESLKDYQWAAQGAIGFLHNAEATFLTAPGGFLDCTEEQRQTQLALEALEDGFQAHINHLSELLPQQSCLSRPETQLLHISLLSQLLVGRAMLEAQAQLRLESLQRCEMRKQSHKQCHEDVRQSLLGLETKVTECAAERVTSYEKCVAQQNTTRLLMKDLRSLAAEMEELRAGCPMQGCGVGKDGELGALWRRWVLVRRSVSLLMAQTQQREEEWKDITRSIQECCGFLASLQADVPDSSNVSLASEEPQELLAQAEVHQAGLEQEQQALASLEHRLEHALGLSSSQDPDAHGPVGRTLVKIQENVRSLKERNQLLVAAAQAEERERQQVQEEIGEVEQHILAIGPSLEASSDQELLDDLSSQKATLKRIADGLRSRYPEVPADISRRLREAELCLQREEEKLVKKNNPLQKLESQIASLGSSLEKVNMLLDQRSPTVSEAKRALKGVWDELDSWHSRLTLLESEVQDLAQDHPGQAHLLMEKLTEPLQLYQDAAHMAEHRTAFLSKIPTCLQEYEGILYSATNWLDEAESWLSSPCSFTTVKNLQSHANNLQLVLDDSERIRNALQDFGPVLDEISAVCDMSSQQEKLQHNDKQVHKMQRKILEPLQHLLEAVGVVEAIEMELNTIERNVPKIRAILSSVENSDIPLREHLLNRQVILANMQAMRRTLEEMQRCKAELQLPQGAEENLLVFSRAGQLLQDLDELEHQTVQQAKLLEQMTDIIEEGHDSAAVSEVTEEVQQAESSLQRYFQEMYEVFNSEEEDDEDNKSCHSSSSDTLTCSIPEDPGETTVLSQDEQSEEVAEVLALPQDQDLVSRGITECAVAELPVALAGDQFTVSTVSQPNPQTQECDLRTTSLQASAAVEDTRLIPLRPTTPFAASKPSSEFMEEDEEDTSSPAPPLKTLQQNEGGSSDLVELFQHGPEVPEVETRRAEDEGPLKWGSLHQHISQKLITLEKFTEELQTHSSPVDKEMSERGLESAACVSAVLQPAQQSIAMLRHIRNNATEASHSGSSEELYKAAWSAFLCLDALTSDLLLTPGGASEDDPLWPLQRECVSTELLTLAQLLHGVESSAGQELQTEARLCAGSLKDGLHKAQLVLRSRGTPCTEQLSMTSLHQELSDWLRLYDGFNGSLGQQETFTPSKASAAFKCAPGRHLRESLGDQAELQLASRSLLQGITHLMQLGQECITEGQTSPVHSRRRLQAAVCRRQKLLRVLRSQLAFVQSQFQRRPESLECHGDEWLQLQAKAKALLHQALEQEVASQRRIQEWSSWEDDCGRLSAMLDDVEAFISSGEPEAADEKLTEHRLDACQQMLAKLDECGAALGLLLDEGQAPQSEPNSTAVRTSISPVGGALKLRWQSACRRAEQAAQRCTDIQDCELRFQNDFSLLSEWLTESSNLLKTWSDLCNAPDLNPENLYKNLIKLLDFASETEAMSAKEASASREAARLLHLREDDCSALRAQLVQMEADWSKLTSDLSNAQEQLQQKLLAAWPPAGLLPELQAWLKQLGSRLTHKKESILKARNAAQITDVLQNLHNAKAGLMKGQLLIDFLCQPGPQVAGQPTRHKHTEFAEELGDLAEQWLHQQRELQKQIRDVEQMHRTCADRERRLQRLCRWTEQQQKQLEQSRTPTCRSAAAKDLLELEAVGVRVAEVFATLQELKASRVHARKAKAHPCDLLFSAQTDSVCHIFRDLQKQMEDLRPALQQAIEAWERFESALGDASVHTTRVHCSLRHPPPFSLGQAEGHIDILELLQEEARKGEELWASADESCQGLVRIVHPGSAQRLEERVERERKRWQQVLQELKEEQTKSRETLSLWQRYSHLSAQCSAQQQQLQARCDDLRSSAAQRDTRAACQSAQQLQESAHDLQDLMGDVLLASKALGDKVDAPAASLIQSECRLLSRSIVQLQKRAAGKTQSLKQELELEELFNTRLMLLEKQKVETDNELKDLKGDDLLKVVSELSASCASLVDVIGLSANVTYNNGEAERVHALSKHWAESMTHVFERNRELQVKRQHTLSLQEQCDDLMSLQKKLEEKLTSSEKQSYSSTKQMLSLHQCLQAEAVMGQHLLQLLLCHMVQRVAQESVEKRAELVARVACVRKSWLSTVELLGQRSRSIRERLSQWAAYRQGLVRLRKMLGEVDPLLPPAGPLFCILHQEHSCYQCVEDALSQLSDSYSTTLEVGRGLCEGVAQAEGRSEVQAELEAVQEHWERSASLLQQRRHLEHTAAKKWTQCQDQIGSMVTELVELERRLQHPLSGGAALAEEEALMQESEVSLQRLATSLRDLATMKTDLSQCVAAGDSALLEQQLEQLHAQWEELCAKVSQRRQEIADRLNAWTIFNDKNKEFCDWLTQMENKVCRSGELSIEEMVEKLKKDCMEEINLFSENKSHLKQLGEQLLLASDEAKQTQVRGSLQELNQRWHNLFHHIEARVKKLKETLATVQQLDKNMSNLRSWLCRMEAELSRPVTYSVCHHQEIKRRLAEQQELQRDIEQHTEGVASVLSLCDVLLQDEDAVGGGGGDGESEGDSLQETSRSLDQRWRTICAMALDRKLRIEETWRLWCKFLEDYSRFEDWLKMAEHSAANPNSAGVLYTVAKEELKKFEGFQRQVHERLTQLELVNNQYRRLARENRTDRASQLKAMVREGNRRWDVLHRRVAAILRRLKHFTSKREEFEGTRENMQVWLTELDLQLTNVEHFSESDVHHKIQQLNSFQKEITLNTERIDGLIVFGEGLIQRSSPEDAALIEDELEELHSYCQEVFGRLVRFHQRLSQPPMEKEEQDFSPLETSLELISRPWLGRGYGSLPATPTHLLSCPLERSGRETPVSVDSLPLEWDHTGDVGGSSSHEDDEDEEDEEEEEEREFFSALSASSASLAARRSPLWESEAPSAELDSEGYPDTPPELTSTPVKPGLLSLMSQCSGSIKDIKRASLILDDGEQDGEEPGISVPTTCDKQSGVIERWELLQAQSRGEQHAGSNQQQKQQQLMSDLDDITSWLEIVTPALDNQQNLEPVVSVEGMTAKAKELREMHKMFASYKSIMLSINLRAQGAPQLRDRLGLMNRQWSRACTSLQQWDTKLRETLMRCQDFQESLHSLLLWLAHADSRRYAVDIGHPDTTLEALQQHRSTLTDLREELQRRLEHQASLHALWSQLQAGEEAEDGGEAQEKLHVTGSKLKLLLRQVDQDLGVLEQRLSGESCASAQVDGSSRRGSSPNREKKDSPPRRSFFYRVLRAAFPLQLLLLFLLLLPCLIPLAENAPGCTGANNFARSFYPMLRYTNGPPPT